MNKDELKFLLRNWELDEKTTNVQEKVFVSQPNEGRCEETDLWHRLDDYIDKAPKNPVKLFNALSLPIDEIYVDSVDGGGFKRTFERGGKKFSRPELVAKDFYESQGYKVTWSEGVAFSMALGAISAELANRVMQHFYVVPRKIYSDDEIRDMQLRGVASIDNIIKNNDFEKERPARFSSGGRGASSVLAELFVALIKNDESRIEYYTNGANGLGVNCSVESLMQSFQDELRNVVLNSSADDLTRWLSDPGEYKNLEYKEKWKYSNWSIEFAKDLLKNFNRESIYEHIKKMGGFSSVWFDLSLFNYATGAIKFVEVKLDDRFTDLQIMDLKSCLFNEIDIGLAKIHVPG